ncbi:MAG: hypothetical protein PVJ21_19160 [Anaerolineales bacterium]|jgi:hypothetical protein
MYPDNLNLLEKTIWSNVEEIHREFNDPYRQPIKVRFISRMLIAPGFLIALVWLVNVAL